VFLKDGEVVQDHERMTRDEIFDTIKNLETVRAERKAS